MASHLFKYSVCIASAVYLSTGPDMPSFESLHQSHSSLAAPCCFQRLTQHKYDNLEGPSPASLPRLPTIRGTRCFLHYLPACPPISSLLRAPSSPPLPPAPTPGIHNVEGVAVDWMGDNLYWTDDGPKKTISVARLEKAAQTRKTLIEGKMTHPRAIVVDPLNG